MSEPQQPIHGQTRMQQHPQTVCERYPLSGALSPTNNNNNIIGNNNFTQSSLNTVTQASVPSISNSYQNNLISNTSFAVSSSSATLSSPNSFKINLPSTMSPEDAPTTSPLAGEEGPSSTPNNTSSGASSPSNSFNLTCMTCHTHFTSAELYARHDCVSSNSGGSDVPETTSLGHNTSDELNRSGSTGNDSGIIQSECEPMIQENSSDVERFDGKIVYNPDGSAYIFDSEMSEDDVGLDIQHQEGSIIDSPSHPLPETIVPSIPHINNAFYVTKNTRAFYNALYGQTLSSLLPENKRPEVPIVHSYRVISVGDKDRDEDIKDKSDKSEISQCNSQNDKDKSSKSKLPLLDYAQVPIKPILMCFVCKLSFGYVRSFIGHAMGDHNVTLGENEKDLLATKNVSAILQVAGREKDPRISFLEPVTPPGRDNLQRQANTSPSKASSGSTSSQQDEDNRNVDQTSPQSKKSEETFTIKEDQPEPMETETPSLCVKREMDLFDQSPRSIHHGVHLSLPPHLQQFHPNHQNLHLPPPSPPFATPQHPGGMRTPDLSRKSPISALSSNGGRSSLSPVTSMSPTSFSPLPSPITQLTGTIIGACPEHMSGRQQGISCDKCDMILQSSRQLSGQMAFMHSRNSCKTLKCPKCNWHYKYQETLEIHMKEKHPDNESSCIYCLTSQPHPRLARGETYTCGYKPYRCEVCNYSTTTKGNLSIHMQSDKHLNNMQELQNGGMPNMDGVNSQNQMMSQSSQQSPSMNGPPKVSTPSSTSLSPPSHQKPKPMWRCDVCNYETNVARNLRIHMTSEKHTHNMMVLQQNVKHMQQLSSIPDPMSLLQANMMHEKQPPPPEVAMADLAYNQALLIQMISGGGAGGSMNNNMGQNPLAVAAAAAAAASGGHNQNPEHMGPHFDLGINPDALEPPPEPVPPNPKAVYTCCVCSTFNTDSLEQLNMHLQLDRSKINENEVLLIVAGNYICKLCSYKTNLKANFQLHCKTDKHLQKLQYVNHVLEGGPRNEWKLKYIANNNPLHVRCNLCEFYTNSVHKLQLHSSHQRHEVLAMLFKHLSSPDHSAPVDRRQFRCCLCSFTTKGKIDLLHHIRSVRHLQMEQIHQIQRHAEGKGATHQDIGDIFKVEEEDDLNTSRDDGKSDSNTGSFHNCSQCSFTGENEEKLQAHVESEHQTTISPKKENTSKEKSSEQPMDADCEKNNNSSSEDMLSCPLCDEKCSDMSLLEKHATVVHSVNVEGLQKLMILIRLSNAAKKEVAAQALAAGNQNGSRETENQNNENGKGSLKSDTSSLSSSVPVSKTGHLMPSPCRNAGDVEKDIKQESRQNQGKNIRGNYWQGVGRELDVTSQNDCGGCGASFKTPDGLSKHQVSCNKLYTGQIYTCWKRGCNKIFKSAPSLHAHFREAHNSTNSQSVAVSEKHVYKYRCQQCSLAFKTVEKLNLHLQYHAIRDATKCLLCHRNFRSVTALQKHINCDHPELSHEERLQYQSSMVSTQIGGDAGPVLDPSTTALLRKESNRENDIAKAVDNDETPKNEDKNSFQIEKYLDPNRPFKCDICKESFTQKNILLVHYNSVSHLHKMKRIMQDNENSESFATKIDQVNVPKPENSFAENNVLSQTYMTPSSLPKSNGHLDASELSSLYHNLKKFPLDKVPSSSQLMNILTATGMTENNYLTHLKNKDTTTTNHQQSFGYSAMSVNALDQPSLLTDKINNENLSNTSDFSFRTNSSKKSGAFHKHLLKSFGFDVVAQFVENELNDMDKANNPESPSKLCKFICCICNKKFSNDIILKTHFEESHNLNVPMKYLQKYGNAVHEFLNTKYSELTGNRVQKSNLKSFIGNFEKTNINENVISENNSKSMLLREGLFGAITDGGSDRDESRERSSTPATASSHGQGHGTPGRNTPVSGRCSTPASQVTPGATNSPSSNAESNSTSTISGSGAVNPQMAEMAAAINALTAAQMQQHMPFNPMMLAGLGLAGLPLHLNPLAAMNLQPPLAPGLHHPMFDPVALANMAANQSSSSNNQNHQNPSEFFLKQQQQQQILQQQQQQHQQAAAAAAVAAANQHKRGRTRITDDQLKILRAHFDINNSPSEDQITEMAGQSGLPPKVIKHWFRNTLFKERQRCKDSPYNFSIPPSTTLNLEEYEKTGETKTVPLNPDEAKEIVQMNRSRDSDDRDRSIDRSIKSTSPGATMDYDGNKPSISEHNRMQEKMNELNPMRSSSGNGGCEAAAGSMSLTSHQHLAQDAAHPHLLPQSSPLPQTGVSAPHFVSSASCSPVGSVSSASYPNTFPSLSSPPTSLSLSSLITSQLENNHMLGHNLPPQTPPHSAPNNLTHPSAGLSPTPSNLSYPTTPPGHNSSGKRANRTRFTDYQIKVLQEFFENNAYPKDDDLEYLSKLLNLSPRVIVVWFQNARQKARKVYENQPPIDPMEENSGRFTRTPGLNYQCKKCLLVFQRYYELIRHQKTHCFKEEDAKRSAQAQAAAAQAAALYHDDNSSHSDITENSSQSREVENAKPIEDSFQCDKCSLVFNRFEQWREHQIVHLMNPALFLNNKVPEPSFPPVQTLPQPSPQTSASLPQTTPPLQPLAQQSLAQFQQHQQQHQQQLASPHIPSISPSPMKRKAEESEDEQSIGGEQQRDKRLRTTILPEQLDYLYQKYQMEANPSRKMLETIAHEVGLKKRVVQVWFQNTRARERKGQFRAHAQVINKKCPFCPAIFKVKSALESHLSSKHSEQFSNGDINIDALPDLDDHYGFGNFGGLSSSNHCSPPHPPSMSQAPSLTMPSLFSPSERPEDSLVKYHEEAIRRYLTDVSLANNSQHNNNDASNNTSGPLKGLNSNVGVFRKEGERPLDLSRNLELARSLGMNFPPAPGTNSTEMNLQLGDSKNELLAAKSAAEKMNEKLYGLDGFLSDDESYHIDVPEGDDNEFGNSNESNPTSPASLSGSNKQSNSVQSKRFRTHMSSTQIKLMKSVFVDYKTPTMIECETLGREIQLPKRVIQVWFQNARAKEKKAKLALMKIIGHEPEGHKPSSECKVCKFEYNSKYSIQDHIFTRDHIDNMRAFIDKQKADNDKKFANNKVRGDDVNSNFNPIMNQFGGNSFPKNNIQLQMAQLMALNPQNNESGHNGEDQNLNSSGESNTGVENTSERLRTDNERMIMESENRENQHNSSAVNNDFNRLQLLHQVYQQMGINGSMTNNTGNGQHPLMQQPMIEG